MFHNLQKYYGKKIGATDGDVGHVSDFYFDDKTWSIRYIGVDTGLWLGGREVLLPPHVFAPTALVISSSDDGVLPANLTRQQIENSPSLDSHRSVSRQFEAEYHRYYGWPVYWQDGAAWSGASAPVVVRPPEGSAAQHAPPRHDGIHLRSAKAVTGYHVHGTDGLVGTVRSFVVHDRSWTIRELVVEIGPWYADKTVLILPEDIARISYEDSRVLVNLSRKVIEQTTRDDVAQAEVGQH